MTRIKRGRVAKRRRKNILSYTKGFVGSHSKLFRTAHQQMMKSLYYSFFDRRKKKNQNKRIWITRINASSRKLKTKYNELISLLKRFIIIINKKMLSEIGKNDDLGFFNIITHLKQ